MNACLATLSSLSSLSKTTKKVMVNNDLSVGHTKPHDTHDAT